MSEQDPWKLFVALCYYLIKKRTLNRIKSFVTVLIIYKNTSEQIRHFVRWGSSVN